MPSSFPWISDTDIVAVRRALVGSTLLCRRWRRLKDAMAMLAELKNRQMHAPASVMQVSRATRFLDFVQ